MIPTICQTSHRMGNSSMKLQIEKVHPEFGAEISGMYLKGLTLDRVYPEIRQAFTDFGMIFIRGLYLTLSEQVGLGRRFGEVQVHVMNQYHFRQLI